MPQILANALPGFRDLRGPVIAGYLWLVFAWLLVQPSLDERPGRAIAGSLYDLGQDIGRVGIATAVSLVTYLLGSVSQELSGRFGARGCAIATPRATATEPSTSANHHGKRSKSPP